MTTFFMRQPLPIDMSGGNWSHFRDVLPAGTEGVRIYAVGDIHGHLDHLLAMQAAIAADRAQHPVERMVIVYLGDLIDRGLHSRSVIEQIAAQQNAANETMEIVCLTGNHDAWLNEFLTDAAVLPLWGRKGGLETLASYDFSPEEVMRAMADPVAAEVMRLALVARMPQRHKEFIATLLLSYQRGGYFFAHAGVNPDRSLGEQRKEDLTWIRDRFLTSRTDFGKVVVHGHTSGPRVESLPNRINVDTGIYATGVLSCVVLEGTERHLITVDRGTLRALREQQMETQHG
ncbi:metallophosphoesterase [Rhizobium miluonense]|uniref:Serine/threonine protein phosphatase 1 n=1 Tax=Rhizobium miluonense TaxID=411945 RepID=A0A1C3VET9_9HYPH|nr:metallophosphoesterase [Rhizobium miluonense]SCB26286.1 serine/threonine protein phosphatase 1 [Rhizobium miluonense]